MNDSTRKAAQELMADPLSPVTRSAKKSVLVFSSLCLLITYTGVVPEEADILGFKFPGLTPSLIRWILLLLLFHGYVSFLAHLAADYLRLWVLTDRYELAVAHELDEASLTRPDDTNEFYYKEFQRTTGYQERGACPQATKLTNLARLVLDFIFPTLFGFIGMAYAIFCGS